MFQGYIFLVVKETNYFPMVVRYVYPKLTNIGTGESGVKNFNELGYPGFFPTFPPSIMGCVIYFPGDLSERF